MSEEKDRYDSGSGVVVAFYVGVICANYYVYDYLAHAIKENPTIQQFISFPFHYYFWLALIVFTGISFLFLLLKALTRTTTSGKEGSKLPWIILILLLLWLSLGIIKGIKYHYFSQYPFTEVILLGLKAAGDFKGINGLFYSLIFWLSLLWLIQLCAKFIIFLLQKIPLLQPLLTDSEQEISVRRFFITGLHWILGGWIALSLGAFFLAFGLSGKGEEMIGHLRGKVFFKQDEQIILEVSGVGYELSVPLAVSEKLSVGEEAALFVHYAVRDDGHYLYGFATLAQRTWFQELLKINGIGAKLALLILSGLGEQLRAIIAAKNSTALTKLPGIGKKTAERILLDLQDRLEKLPSLGVEQPPNTARADAEAALLALGYKPAEITAWFAEIPPEAAESAGSLIQQALRLKLQG